jgi:hypothetical protein
MIRSRRFAMACYNYDMPSNYRCREKLTAQGERDRVSCGTGAACTPWISIHQRVGQARLISFLSGFVRVLGVQSRSSWLTAGRRVMGATGSGAPQFLRVSSGRNQGRPRHGQD